MAGQSTRQGGERRQAPMADLRHGSQHSRPHSRRPCRRPAWLHSGSVRRIGVCALLAPALFAASANSARALDLIEARWGFNGRATAHHFNILSLLVGNSGPAPFDGTLQLEEVTTGGSRVGALLAEDVYIAPNSSRWVQFYPFVTDRLESWPLHWKNRGGPQGGPTSASLPTPTLGAQDPVLLVDADDLSARGRGGPLRQFPENLFPPLVTATDTLKTVALDHVPRWEEARRLAFRDWR